VILALETSCDETCAAVMTPSGELLASIVASQAADHAAYGGVVPEIASRRHLELLPPTVAAALAEAGCSSADVTLVAVSAGPGLIGALLVGVSYAKGFAYANDVPLVAVDHLHGHVASLALADAPPVGAHLVLLASGGHTLLIDVDAHRLDLQGYRSFRFPTRLTIQLETASREMLDDRRGVIRFFPDGSSTGGRIIVENQGHGYQIGVIWLTGRIELAPWEAP
jgi:hypothetical protein